MSKKVCNKCGVEKELTEFGKRKDSKDGHRPTCKLCVKNGKPVTSAEGSVASNKHTPTNQEKPMGRKPTVASVSEGKGNTVIVAVQDLHVKEGHNIRDIDMEHAENFCAAYLAGHYVPPLAVKMTPQGVQVVFGHHRYEGYKLALAQDPSLPGLECQELKHVGADEEVAMMLRENDGKPLTGLERAGAYARLSKLKWSIDKIAESVQRSRSDVEKHLILAEATEPVKQLVADGTISVSTAIEFVRKYGDDAHTEITKQLAKQAGVGKGNKRPGSQIKPTPKFPAKKDRVFVDLLAEKIQFDEANSDDTINIVFAELSNEEYSTLMQIVEDYKDFLDEQDKI